MNAFINYKKAISITLFCFVIALHAFLRIVEIPYAFPLLDHSFWVPAINVAAGKGLTDDQSYRRSPELSSFSKQPFINPDWYNKPMTTKLSFFNSFYDFTDYIVNTDTLEFPDSRGLRWVIGLTWKILGFNWFHVGLVNYFLSFLALFSLMICSYRTLGIAYSIAIGLIYSLSPIEIHYVASFGRDGIPLWFACYLISILIFMFNKALTLKGLISYPIGTGLIIYAAIEGRSSTIYFIPLIAIIYFFLFFFYEEKKINFKYSYMLKNSFLRKSFCFLLATCLMVIVPLSLEAITNAFYPHWGAGASWGVIFEGMGLWGGLYNPFHPSQVRYYDGNVSYIAEDYAQRILNLNYQQTQNYIASKFGAIGDFVSPVYFSIIKTYPYFFIHDVVLGSIKNTLLYLGRENEVYEIPQHIFRHRESVVYFFYKKYSYIFINNFLFLLSIVGAMFLYFKLKFKKISVILLFFMFFNACVSFLKFEARHVLMGHPAYYFLSGVTIAYLYENFAKKSFFHTMQPWKKHVTLKLYIVPFLFLLFVWPIYISSINKLKHIEMNNIKKMQVVFDSLNKKPLDIDFTKEPKKLSNEFLHKTIGIYCELGDVVTPQKITINVVANGTAFYYGPQFYHTEIMPVVGKNVTLFYPFYFMNDSFAIKIDDHNQCKSFYWSDLKDWDGPLWEGTYDRDTLKN